LFCFVLLIKFVLKDECSLVVLDFCQRVPYGVLYSLDVTPTAVEQLNYAQCYPMLICFNATDQRQIKYFVMNMENFNKNLHDVYLNHLNV
jgi:hypothetical protein